METPKEIKLLVDKAIKQFDNAQDSITWLVSEIAKLDYADEWFTYCVRKIAETIVYERRHEINRAMKSTKGYTHSKTETRWMESKTIQDIYTVYEFKISGRNLGDILGSELPGIIEQEESILKGHEKNLLFLNKIRNKVPENKTVREAITLKALTKIFKSVYRSEEVGA